MAHHHEHPRADRDCGHGPERHDHGHGHAHHHGHAHSHGLPTGPGASMGRAFLISIVLNAGFVAIEFVYGFLANSTSLLADAGHNLSDVLGLVLAWGAAGLSRRPPSDRFTYGLRASSILAALANAMLLLVACGAIGLEALQRLLDPPPVQSVTVMLVAGAGVVVNGISAWLFTRGSQADLNIRGAYLHMLADAMVSLGVLAGGAVMVWARWYWLDPVISMVVLGVILWGTWGLLRDSVGMALNAVPPGVDVAAVRAWLAAVPGVSDVHDLHIWAVSTTETALTAHLVMPQGHPGDAVIESVAHELRERFGIHHPTLQLELAGLHHACSLHGAAARA